MRKHKLLSLLAITFCFLGVTNFQASARPLSDTNITSETTKDVEVANAEKSESPDDFDEYVNNIQYARNVDNNNNEASANQINKNEISILYALSAASLLIGLLNFYKISEINKKSKGENNK